jgi:hypothetical protein
MMCAPAAVTFIEVDAGWVIKIRSEDKVNPEGPGVDSEGAVGLSKRKAPEVSLEVDPGPVTVPTEFQVAAGLPRLPTGVQVRCGCSHGQ